MATLRKMTQALASALLGALIGSALGAAPQSTAELPAQAAVDKMEWKWADDRANPH